MHGTFPGLASRVTTPRLSMTVPQHRRCECTFDGRVVRLQPQERDLVALFLLRKGRWTSREDIIEWLYSDPDAEPESAWWLVATKLGHLRRKLGRELLDNNYKFGWMLAEEYC